MAKKRAEAKIVFILFLLVELLIIALVVMKGKYKQLEIEPWQLMAIGGGFLVIYVFYLKFRTQTVEQHVVDEKVKTSVLIEALPGGVVVLDEEGLVVSINQKAATAFAVFKDWGERHDSQLKQEAIVARLRREMGQFHEAVVFPIVLLFLLRNRTVVHLL